MRKRNNVKKIVLIPLILSLFGLLSCSYFLDQPEELAAFLIAHSDNMDPIHVELFGKTTRLEPGEQGYMDLRDSNSNFKEKEGRYPIRLYRMDMTLYRGAIDFSDSRTLYINLIEEGNWGNFRVRVTRQPD